MTEPATPWRFPWGLMLTTALLAGVVIVTFVVFPGIKRAAPAEVTVAVVVCAAAVFWAMRRLQNYLWGVVAALVLVMHPLYWQWEVPRVFQTEAAELVTLAMVVAACAIMYQAEWAWRSWLVLGALACAAGGAAWQVAPTAGRATGLLQLGALPLVAVLAWRKRRRQDMGRPCLGNVICGLMLGLLAPVAGLLLGCLPELGSTGRAEVVQPLDLLRGLPAGFQLRGSEYSSVQQWSWFTPWAVVPLMLWGGWCTLRRGWRELARRQAPTAWALTLYAILSLAATALQPHDNVLPMASLAVLLTVFGIADVLRNIWDQLRLAPPDERAGAQEG